MADRMGWSIIIPLSAAPTAKSRLRSLGSLRLALAQAFAQDVVDTVTAVPAVSSVIVVGDGSIAIAGSHERIDPGDVGLNPAIVAAEQRARELGFNHIAVLMADLPCLRAADVVAVLAQARTVPRGFVRDHHGTGTTLISTTGPSLLPRFGPHSAGRHGEQGALEITAPARARLDVDDPEDMAVALVFGLGRATTAVVSTSGAIEGRNVG